MNNYAYKSNNINYVFLIMLLACIDYALLVLHSQRLCLRSQLERMRFTFGIYIDYLIKHRYMYIVITRQCHARYF